MAKLRFVVKATAPDGTHERWVTTGRLAGYRTFGPRPLAAQFIDWDVAEYVIQQLRKHDNCAEVEFEVQPIR